MSVEAIHRNGMPVSRKLSSYTARIALLGRTSCRRIDERDADAGLVRDHAQL